MTRMRPTYAPTTVGDRAYEVVRYREWWSSDPPEGCGAVLFLPGNGGDFRQVRSLGLFGCADIVSTSGPDAGNRVSSLAGGGPNAEKIGTFKKAMLDEGLISLFRNCMIHAAPPLIITEDEMRDGFDRMHRALKTANF